MPITAFSSFTDGLVPDRRDREHFITNLDLSDERRWVRLGGTTRGMTEVTAGLRAGDRVVLPAGNVTVTVGN